MMDKDGLIGLAKKAAKSGRGSMVVDHATLAELIALATRAVEERKAKTDRTVLNIRVDDCGGYYQVYEETPCSTDPARKPTYGGETKLGNIYPPGHKLFGEVLDPTCFVADHAVYGRASWQNTTRALAYLVSPRGMA